MQKILHDELIPWQMFFIGLTLYFIIMTHVSLIKPQPKKS